MPSDTLEEWLKTQRGADNFFKEDEKFQQFFKDRFAEATALMENSGGTMTRNEAMTEVILKVWEELEAKFRAGATEAQVPHS